MRVLVAATLSLAAAFSIPQLHAQTPKAGGTLVYATCSLEPEEGEEIARGASLAGLATNPIDQAELFPGMSPTSEGWLRVLPGQGRDVVEPTVSKPKPTLSSTVRLSNEV